jgi:flagellar basal-body rod modification protein FlgD
MTMPVSGSSVPTGVVAPTSASSSGMASLLQPNTFLTLLVDELKYQDPMNPASSTDFMNQIAQLSQVEQLSAVSQASTASEAASLIGKSVTGSNLSGKVITGVVTGASNGANGPTLNVNGDVMNLSAVTQIGSA